MLAFLFFFWGCYGWDEAVRSQQEQTLHVKVHFAVKRVKNKFLLVLC